MDQEKLVQNFNQALMTTRKVAIETGEGKEILLKGSLQDKSDFVVELVSNASNSQIDRVALRVSSNTKNLALFTDMFLTLKTGPAMPRPGSKGEWVGVMVVDTQHLSVVNKKLVQFFNKAKNGEFNSHLIMEEPLLSKGNVFPINKNCQALFI